MGKFLSRDPQNQQNRGSYKAKTHMVPKLQKMVCYSAFFGPVSRFYSIDPTSGPQRQISIIDPTSGPQRQIPTIDPQSGMEIQNQ